MEGGYDKDPEIRESVLVDAGEGNLHHKNQYGFL